MMHACAEKEEVDLLGRSTSWFTPQCCDGVLYAYVNCTSQQKRLRVVGSIMLWSMALALQ